MNTTPKNEKNCTRREEEKHQEIRLDFSSNSSSLESKSLLKLTFGCKWVNAWQGGSLMESHSYFYKVPFV